MSKSQHATNPKFSEIKAAIIESLKQLTAYDFDLLEIDASERAITHKLAEYIQHHFPDRNVDCEYNRNVDGNEQKAKIIHILKSEREKELRNNADEELMLALSTYPDIIVHERKSNVNNLLIIEVKKKSNPIGNSFDFLKLCKFTENEEPNVYNYRLGLFIMLGTGDLAKAEPDLIWFIGGKQVK